MNGSGSFAGYSKMHFLGNEIVIDRIRDRLTDLGITRIFLAQVELNEGGFTDTLVSLRSDLEVLLLSQPFDRVRIPNE